MPETNKALLIKLRDPAALARSQGALASLAQGVAPATIEGKVYEGLRDQVGKSFKDKGIEADMSIVDPKNFMQSDGVSHVAADIGFAIGGAGVIGLLWFLFSGKGHRK